jgi:6-phosphofructokinase 1
LPIHVFVSYHFADEEAASILSYLLRQQPDLVPFLYAEQKRTDEWPVLLIERLKTCNAFVYLAGKAAGETQRLEANWHFQSGVAAGQQTIIACLKDCEPPEEIRIRRNCNPIQIRTVEGERDPLGDIARQIAVNLTGVWVPPDGVPLGYLFDNEKKIIEAYLNKRLSAEKRLPRELLEKGCPPDWPQIVRNAADRQLSKTIESQIGTFRDPSEGIAVDTRTSYGTPDGNDKRDGPLTFPEAGPREFHRYPLHGQVQLRVGILVSGGIAPGINAVIDGIVKRHELYHEAARKHALYLNSRQEYTLSILGYREGLQSLSNDAWRAPLPLSGHVIDRQAEMGGSLLPTSRWDQFVDATTAERDGLLNGIVRFLQNIDILYVIGGDGSMRAAHSVWKVAHEMAQRGQVRRHVSVVGIPKTMDNDILWVWQSFGFLSAVEKAREAVLNLHTEGKSNPRLCILQLFGSDSGFVASHAGLASGVCDAVLIPEVDYTMEGLFQHLQNPLNGRYADSPHAMVVMAETAIPLDARMYIASESNPASENNLLVDLSTDEIREIQKFFDQGRRVRGQTPDHLRTGGLKIVSGVLQKMIKQRLEPRDYWTKFRVFTSEPRHLIRSVPPSTSDVIFAERLGALAVDNAMAGYTDFMVSQWLTEFVLVPLELVILGRKRVPPNGIFWKSVLASTGQPEDMTQGEQ